MDTQLILLIAGVTFSALCAALLVVLVLDRKRRGDEVASKIDSSLRKALDDAADASEERQNRFELRFGQAADQTRSGIDAVRRESLDMIRRSGEGQEQRLASLQASLASGLAAVNETVDRRLTSIQQQNDAKLEKMRETVEEKLQSTLETRLGESFRLIGGQLQELERGLGEMQGLASNVDSLRRIMANVKTRGTFGEAQCRAILEDILTPEQYAENVETVPGSGRRVEFAVRMPGPEGKGLWLPIDSKFPQEDWERLEEARASGDRDAETASAKALRLAADGFAKDISTKYLKPPFTTEFAVMYLPTESLYAEILRIPGFQADLQSKWHVMPAGPTVLSSLLNSLRMGFRTLAIQERSADVWKLLGSVKFEFGQFQKALSGVEQRLRQAQDAVEAAQRRTRSMGRSLSEVEATPRGEEEANAAVPKPSEGTPERK